MERLLLLLIICIALVPIQARLEFPDEKCIRPHEEFDDCKSLCTETCLTINDTTPCVPGCAVGCTCKEGYVRNFNYVCVSIDDCKHQNNTSENYKDDNIAESLEEQTDMIF